VLPELTAAFALLALCVTVHAVGLALALPRIAVWHAIRPVRRSVRAIQVLIAIASWLLVLHLIETAVWAVFYFWAGCLPDLETSLYFSGVTYATVGFGDVVLPHGWRLLAPMEGLTGILMCGLSTGFFFVVVSRLSERPAASLPPIRGE
jgi:Ion channel